MAANISTLKAKNPEVGSSQVIFSFVLGLEVLGIRLAGGHEERVHMVTERTCHMVTVRTWLPLAWWHYMTGLYFYSS